MATFPANPNVGDQVKGPGGVPIWQWDGTKWTAVSANTFVYTTQSFTTPSVGGTVTVGFTSVDWIVVGLPLFIGGATYVVQSLSGLNVTMQRV